MIEINEALRLMIHNGSGEHELLREARQHGAGILDDGRRRVLAGETSVEEVLRVTAAY